MDAPRPGRGRRRKRQPLCWALGHIGPREAELSRRPDGREARQGLGLGVKDNLVGRRVRCCAHMIKDHALLRTDRGLGYIRSGAS